jgi:hypothetical protein
MFDLDGDERGGTDPVAPAFAVLGVLWMRLQK